LNAPIRPRLWVVDDSEFELQSICRTLEPLYDLERFSDGSTVLERAAATSELPDVLVLDWHMQGVGGLDVLRFLRSQQRTIGLPILVFTATSTPEDLLEALKSGADDFVQKGASTAELNARVATLVRANSLRERAERAERELAVLLGREREARAEAEAANREKDHFLANVSHELRTPLTAILGWSRILRMGTTDPVRTERALATIERNALAQAKIIDDLLDVSRIVSGKLRLELGRVSVADALAQVLESVAPAAGAKGIEIETSLDPMCVIAADAARLQQIAWNLLSNAIKFTPNDGRIEVRLLQQQDQVLLSVRDTGCGIAADFLPHVFDRFRQADPTTSRTQGGLGLGLAIVRQLVALHGGQISASSQGAGLGARFEVSFPALVWLPSHAEPSNERSARALAGDLSGLLVLVVDDEPDVRELMRTLLGGCGARVLEAGSAEEALSALESHVPDVILCDIAMPVQDGYALMREIRGRGAGKGGWIPAIAVTALAREEDRWEVLAAGFQAHVPKPIDTAVLVDAVTRLCASRRSDR
jgi:signal transduction histidine kinase